MVLQSAIAAGRQGELSECIIVDPKGVGDGNTRKVLRSFSLPIQPPPGQVLPLTARSRNLGLGGTPQTKFESLCPPGLEGWAERITGEQKSVRNGKEFRTPTPAVGPGAAKS